MKKVKRKFGLEADEGFRMAVRPVGIAIISIFEMVIGALVILGGLVLIVFSGIIAATMPKAAEEVAINLSQLPGVPFGIHRMVAPGLILVSVGVFIIILGVIMAVIGWGLWVGANWARWIAIVFFGWNALTSLFSLFQGQFGSIVSLAISGLVVYYLFLPHVKRFFKASV